MQTERLDTTHHTGFLDKVFAGFDEREALEARKRCLERMEKAQTAVEFAMQQADHSQRELSAINETILAWERWSGQRLTPVTPVTEADHGTNGSGGTGGRAAIRKLFAEHFPDTEWTTPTVAEAMGLGKEHHHAIQVHLSRMARDGELLRPRKGVYTLPPEGRTPEGEEGGGGPATPPA